MNNLHRHNLEVLNNLEKNQELKMVTYGDVQNKLMPDESYLGMIGWRANCSVEQLMQVYSASFYHFLNLIQLPNPRLMSSCINLSQLNHTEFQLGVILLLETSLKGLFRFENYCRSIDTKKADTISKVIAKLSNDLVSYKSSVLDLNKSLENERRLFMQLTIKKEPDVAKDVIEEDDVEGDGEDTENDFDDFENIEDFDDDGELDQDHGLTIPSPPQKEPEPIPFITRVRQRVSKVVTSIGNWCYRQINRFMNLFRSSQ